MMTRTFLGTLMLMTPVLVIVIVTFRMLWKDDPLFALFVFGLFFWIGLGVYLVSG